MTWLCNLTSWICRRRSSRAYPCLPIFGMRSGLGFGFFAIRLLLPRTAATSAGPDAPAAPDEHGLSLAPEGFRLCVCRGDARRSFGISVGELIMTKIKPEVKVVVSKNGPYLVSGDIPLAKQTIVSDAEDGSQAWKESDPFPPQASYALCRCGHSKNKPFCDGT